MNAKMEDNNKSKGKKRKNEGEVSDPAQLLEMIVLPKA
jgi:hypothetical protein